MESRGSGVWEFYLAVALLKQQRQAVSLPSTYSFIKLLSFKRTEHTFLVDAISQSHRLFFAIRPNSGLHEEEFRISSLFTVSVILLPLSYFFSQNIILN